MSTFLFLKMRLVLQNFSMSSTESLIDFCRYGGILKSLFYIFIYKVIDANSDDYNPMSTQIAVNEFSEIEEDPLADIEELENNLSSLEWHSQSQRKRKL